MQYLTFETQSLQQKNLAWFPRMRTLSLAVDAEGESEQNDVKLLQEKLDNTTREVQALSTQLKELREQVEICLLSCNLFSSCLLFFTNML